MLIRGLYKIFTPVFGLIYPAYRSFVAVKEKNVKEYVNWMMYWIVYALYSSVEPVMDMVVGWWCPFYDEAKLCFLCWIVFSKAGNFIYRKYVHPAFCRHEKKVEAFYTELKARPLMFLLGPQATKIQILVGYLALFRFITQKRQREIHLFLDTLKPNQERRNEVYVQNPQEDFNQNAKPGNNSGVEIYEVTDDSFTDANSSTSSVFRLNDSPSAPLIDEPL